MRPLSKLEKHKPWPWPPCTPTLPRGFDKNGYLVNSMFLGSNVDYWAANMLVPLLMAVGLDTPNKVTYFNFIVPRCASIAIAVAHGYRMVGPLGMGLAVPLLFLAGQILDAADGQMARRHKLGSEFGQWLDHFTDTLFGGVIALATFVPVIYQHGFYSWAGFCLAVFSVLFFPPAAANLHAKETDIPYCEYSSMARLGLQLELWMSYIGCAVCVSVVLYLDKL